MEKLVDLISDTVSKAFEAAGYDAALGRVTVSNRPDLCQFQCNGAMPAARQYHKAPIAIANDVADQLKGCSQFSMVQAAAPGFLNLNLSDEALSLIHISSIPSGAAMIFIIVILLQPYSFRKVMAAEARCV